MARSPKQAAPEDEERLVRMLRELALLERCLLAGQRTDLGAFLRRRTARAHRLIGERLRTAERRFGDEQTWDAMERHYNERMETLPKVRVRRSGMLRTDDSAPPVPRSELAFDLARKDIEDDVPRFEGEAPNQRILRRVRETISSPEALRQRRFQKRRTRR